MRVFTAVIFLGAFLVLIGMPEEILSHRTTTVRAPRPHEVWNDCGTLCEDNCATYPRERSCNFRCNRGWFCDTGYIRETPDGNCVLPSECPARG